MKTIKNFKILIIILFSTLFYVSCADKTTIEITLSYYAGNWYSDGNHFLTINSDGSIDFIENSGKKNIPPSDITRNSDKSYRLKDGSELNFNNSTQGTFKPQGNDEAQIITKK